MTGAAADAVHGQEAERWGGWSWRAPSRGEHFRTCSFCGSIHPEDLANEAGWAADWADRKYGWPHKFYVRIPNRTPEQRFIVSATNAETPPQGASWSPAVEIPDDVNTEGWRDVAANYTWVQIGTHTTHHAKFYTTHLADPAVNRLAVDRIQAVSGLAFRFSEGRVSWAPAQ